MRPDEQLIAGLRQGDRRAFDLLFERHHARIYSVALGILRNEAEAEDVVQDTFIKAYRRIDQFRGDAALQTWLISIAVNGARDRIRRRSVRRVLSLEVLHPAVLLRALGAGNDPGTTMAEKEQRQSLWDTVDELPLRLRLPIILRYQQGLSCGEIAEALDLSLSTIYTQLSEGRQQLREWLEDEPATTGAPAPAAESG